MSLIRAAAVVAVSGLLATGALAQSFEGVVNSALSTADLLSGAELSSGGTLIGDYDAATNPGGTQTRPGLFGGSGNNAIPVGADFVLDAVLDAEPAGGVAFEADFDALTLRFDAVSLDLLNGSAAATDVGVTLTFNTFNTINPSFIYPGGIPFDVPLGEIGSVTRAELALSGASETVLIETETPETFEFTVMLPAEVSLTVTSGLLGGGGEPVGTEIEALPLILVVSGTLTRAGDGSVVMTLQADAVAESTKVPLETGPLPTAPVELPTLGTATAGVLLSLTPESLVVDATLGLSLTVGATAPDCQADWNGDSALNVFDVFAYLGDYNAGNPEADLVVPLGVINVFDLFEYLALYNAGCP